MKLQGKIEVFRYTIVGLADNNPAPSIYTHTHICIYIYTHTIQIDSDPSWRKWVPSKITKSYPLIHAEDHFFSTQH